jgi:hypothetical protein
MPVSYDEVTKALKRLAGGYPTQQYEVGSFEAVCRRYYEDLRRFSSYAVREGCERAGRSKSCKRFPSLAQLLEFVQTVADEEREQQLLQQLAERNRSAELRNEAIQLLGEFERAAARQLAPSTAYRNFIAEAARMWGKVRPQGGLAEVDAIRGARAAYSFALIAWARSHLGLEPIPAAYITPQAREIHFTMTGRQVEVAAGVMLQAGNPVAALASALRLAK